MDYSELKHRHKPQLVIEIKKKWNETDDYNQQIVAIKFEK